MKNSVTNSVVIGLSFAILAQGCTTTGLTASKLKGAEELVGTSGEKPSVSKNYVERGDVKLFMGFSDQIHDLDVALRSAEMDAKKHMVEYLSTELRNEGMRGQSGYEKEAVGRFFEDSQAWLTKNIRVSGAVLLSTYWEKWSRQGDAEVTYFYRGYAVVQISKTDYARARELAIEKLIDKAALEKNRQAEKAARDVRDRLLSGEEKEE